jgi:hypothetical protein
MRLIINGVNGTSLPHRQIYCLPTFQSLSPVCCINNLDGTVYIVDPGYQVGVVASANNYSCRRPQSLITVVRTATRAPCDFMRRSMVCQRRTYSAHSTNRSSNTIRVPTCTQDSSSRGNYQPADVLDNCDITYTTQMSIRAKTSKSESTRSSKALDTGSFPSKLVQLVISRPGKKPDLLNSSTSRQPTPTLPSRLRRPDLYHWNHGIPASRRHYLCFAST